MLYITTSWDDGHVLDKRLADLLDKYDIPGTFYVSKNYVDSRLSEIEIKELGIHHEIGAHTMSHPNLTNLGELEALHEMRESKAWLEGVLGKEVRMFCYPAGHHDERVAHLAREVGFAGARTTVSGEVSLPKDPYLLGTTIQVYPFPLRKVTDKHYYWGKLLQPLFERYTSLRSMGVSPLFMWSWRIAALRAFQLSLKRGGMFHLWGHSWEIERYGMWKDLEWLLARMAEQKGEIRFVTNGELLNASKTGSLSS